MVPSKLSIDPDYPKNNVLNQYPLISIFIMMISLYLYLSILQVSQILLALFNCVFFHRFILKRLIHLGNLRNHNIILVVLNRNNPILWFEKLLKSFLNSPIQVRDIHFNQLNPIQYLFHVRQYYVKQSQTMFVLPHDFLRQHHIIADMTLQTVNFIFNTLLQLHNSQLPFQRVTHICIRALNK